MLENQWHRVNRVPVADTTHFVDDVVEDEVYEFRVVAVNEAGLSKPSEISSPAVKIEDPPSKCKLLLNPIHIQQRFKSTAAFQHFNFRTFHSLLPSCALSTLFVFHRKTR